MWKLSCSQFVIQLLPFIVRQLATLDFLTRNLAHVGYQTVHQLPYPNETIVTFTGGTITVAAEGDTFTITADLTDGQGNPYHCLLYTSRCV